jgi:hypothetical protein
MKPGLKRIEATLHDLGVQDNQLSAETPEGKKRPCSFRISVGTHKYERSGNKSTEYKNHTVDTNTDTQDTTHSQTNSFAQNRYRKSVQAFSSPEHPGKTPNLPRFKTPSFSNHRHGANPGFAITLLQEIQETVASWQAELQAIMQQIQDIYLEGPVINGWLESNPQGKETSAGTATLRHAEIDQLMDYVQEICQPTDKTPSSPSRTGYHLCGIDAAGKVWSRECPVNQVPTVSMAIARYQKLRQLFGRKQYLETRLNQLAETLVTLHSEIQQS